MLEGTVTEYIFLLQYLSIPKSTAEINNYGNNVMFNWDNLAF